MPFRVTGTARPGSRSSDTATASRLASLTSADTSSVESRLHPPLQAAVALAMAGACVSMVTGTAGLVTSTEVPATSTMAAASSEPGPFCPAPGLHVAR